MKRLSRFLLCVSLLTAAAGGCVASRDHTPESRDRLGTETRGLRQSVQLDRGLEDRILALDPENVTERDITDVLSHGPTPRIINLRGGAPLVYLAMESFSNFLIGMGYPEDKIRNPRDGSYSYSSFKSSREIAGILAWYYEKEGMPPMLIGHSAGGMKAVKVLYELAGAVSASVPVWNPLTEEPEERSSILDPRTGAERPVVGLTLGYATAVGSGGLASLFPASLFPHEWDMLRKRKLIPDTVEHFTGFYMQMDVVGGDMFGLLAEPNNYKANGVAKVRNVRLPFTHNHVTVPVTAHLAGEKAIRDWLNAYTPTDAPELTAEFDAPTTNILWAADVWHSVKKQWCLEAQRAVRAKRSMQKSP
jgi:hypothetical protein